MCIYGIAEQSNCFCRLCGEGRSGQAAFVNLCRREGFDFPVPCAGGIADFFCESFLRGICRGEKFLFPAKIFARDGQPVMLFLENFLCGGNHNCDFSVKLSCGAEEAGWFFVKVFAREGRGSGKIFSAAKRVQTDVAPAVGRGQEYCTPQQGSASGDVAPRGWARAGMPYLAREKHKSSVFFNPKGSVLEKHAKQAEKRQKTTPARRLTGDFCSRRYSIV